LCAAAELASENESTHGGANTPIIMVAQIGQQEHAMLIETEAE
jgi:hypothetical protein